MKNAYVIINAASQLVPLSGLLPGLPSDEAFWQELIARLKEVGSIIIETKDGSAIKLTTVSDGVGCEIEFSTAFAQVAECLTKAIVGAAVETLEVDGQYQQAIQQIVIAWKLLAVNFSR